MPITYTQFFQRVDPSVPLGRIPTEKDLADTRKGLEASDHEYHAALTRRAHVQEHRKLNPNSPSLAKLLREHQLACDLAETRLQLWRAQEVDYTRRYHAARTLQSPSGET